MAVEQMLCYSKLEQLFHRVYPALRNFPVSENKRRVLKSLQRYRRNPCAGNRNSLVAYNSYLRSCNSYNFRKRHFKELDIHDLFFR